MFEIEELCCDLLNDLVKIQNFHCTVFLADWRKKVFVVHKITEKCNNK